MFRQATAIFRINMGTLTQRLGSSSVVVAGIAGVVGVLVSVLALSNGLQQTFAATGRADRAIVIAKGAFSEGNSLLSQDAVSTMASADGVSKDAAGHALVSREFVTQLRLVALADRVPKNVILRGVEPRGLAIRPELRIVEGRAFQPGRHEVMVGRVLQSQFDDL